MGKEEQYFSPDSFLIELNAKKCQSTVKQCNKRIYLHLFKILVKPTDSQLKHRPVIVRFTPCNIRDKYYKNRKKLKGKQVRRTETRKNHLQTFGFFGKSKSRKQFKENLHAERKDLHYIITPVSSHDLVMLHNDKKILFN